MKHYRHTLSDNKIVAGVDNQKTPSRIRKRGKSGKQGLFQRAMLFAALLTGGVAAAQPVISSLSAVSGIPGAPVTINGSGFNPTAASNIVYFGATKATVTSASATSLSVNVPAGATYKEVSVMNTASSLTAFSRFPFLPTFNGSATSLSFGSPTNLGVGSQPFWVTIQDIDGDGKPDIAMANNASASISIYRNISSSGTITAGSFASRVDISTGGYPRQVEFADIDGDGKMDMIVASTAVAAVYIHRNIGSPGNISTSSFSAPVTRSVAGSVVLGIAVNDIDGDGKPDLAVGSYPSYLSLLRNVGSPGSITASSLTGPAVFTTGNYPQHVALTDMDNDGKADVLVNNMQDGTVSIYRNVSSAGSITTSSLASPVYFSTGSSSTYPQNIAVGDIDGDGKTDMVTSNNNTGTISVFRNIGTGAINSGSFATHVDFSSASYASRVALADVNGDGKPDIIVSNGGTAAVSVFRNVSTPGSFTTSSLATRADFSVYEPGNGVAAGDLNNDGKPDLISTGVNLTMSVVQNNHAAGADPITGTLSVCAGSTTALSHTTSGGTWSSSNTSVATVGSSDGIVTGMAAGTAVITYTFSGGSVTATVTVNASPTVAAITGNTTLSTAITTQLANATGSGAWASSNTSVATVNSSTGLVTGIAAGSSLISYSVSASGCTKTVTTNVTVNTPDVGLYFDGTNDFVSVPNNTSFESATGTVEMWIKPTWSPGTRPGNPTLGSMRPVAHTTTRWSFHMNNGLNGIGLYNGISYNTVSYAFTTNKWYHVAFVFTTSNCAVYVNGVFVAYTGNA